MRERTSRLVLGAAAGIVGTATMSAVMAVARAGGFLGEPPPRKLTRRISSAIGLRLPRGTPLDLATMAGHVGYGVAMGMLYSLLPRRASTMSGALFGLAVWAVSYKGWIPKLGLMPPPAIDRPGRPTSMILAHLVFGATLGGVHRRLGAESRVAGAAHPTTAGPPR